MSIYSELLDIARELLDGAQESGSPHQAGLRRAVSTLYYAFFHFLIERSLESLTNSPEVRSLISRAYKHEDMAKTCAAFDGHLSDQIKAVYGGNVDVDLKRAAKLFVDLQRARHRADYNLDASLAHSDAKLLLSRIEETINKWNAIENLPITQIFLAALLLNQHWNRKD